MNDDQYTSMNKSKVSKWQVLGLLGVAAVCFVAGYKTGSTTQVTPRDTESLMDLDMDIGDENTLFMQEDDGV